MLTSTHENILTISLVKPSLNGLILRTLNNRGNYNHFLLLCHSHTPHFVALLFWYFHILFHFFFSFFTTIHHQVPFSSLTIACTFFQIIFDSIPPSFNLFLVPQQDFFLFLSFPFAPPWSICFTRRWITGNFNRNKLLTVKLCFSFGN